MNKKQWFVLALVTVASLGLMACGRRASRQNADAKTDLKAAIVTDIGGVDDRSFNQSAWEGLEAWGKENGLSKDQGIAYFQSNTESDFANNFEQAASSGYNLIFGPGFALRNAVEAAAKDHTDLKYVMIDDVVDLDNVANVTFADHEAAYLAGVAAAKTTKTKHVGFIGGMEGKVITRFEKGFEAGVKSVDPAIKVDVQYAGSFNDAAKGKSIAAAQYAAGADVIFHASGATGNGLINEARSINEKRGQEDKVWVIGVDRDQSAEGEYTDKDGQKANLVLASTLKEVGNTVKDISNKTAKGEFPGKTTSTYGLKDGGVNLAMTGLSDEAKKAVEEAKMKITDGSVKVPEE